jgi:hypothetical protein
LALALLNFCIAFSQEAPKNWNKSTELGLAISQVSLTNWAAGGDNSIAGNGYFNFIAKYNKEKTSWDNGLSLAYGLSKQGDLKVRKTDDKIDFYSKYGHKIAKHWDASALLNFKSQFAKGYNYKVSDSTVISNFLAPGYILLGTGLDYKPVDYFSVFVSPLTGRLTIVTDTALVNAGAYGVAAPTYDGLGNVTKKGDHVKTEFGASVKLMFKKDIWKNVNLQLKMQLFSDYLKNPQNIDIDAEMALLMKINEYLSTNIVLNTLYDHDINITDKDGNVGPRTQFKEVFGVGFVYKF